MIVDVINHGFSFDGSCESFIAGINSLEADRFLSRIDEV
jgi:hypothetical protein